MATSIVLQLVAAEIKLARLAFLRWILRSVVIIFLILALLQGNQASQSLFFGFFFITLPLGLAFDLYHLFIIQEINKYRSLHAKGGLSISVAHLLVMSRKDIRRLWFYLLREGSVHFLLLRLGLSANQFQDNLPQLNYQQWLQEAEKLATAQQRPLLPEHLFECLQTQANYAVLWRDLGLSDQERREIWNWYYRLETRIETQKQGFIASLRFSGGIGRDWSSGYTHALQAFTQDLTQVFQQAKQSLPLVGHSNEKAKIVEYLSRSELHNIVITGEEGVGKQHLMYAVAAAFAEGTVPLSLRYKHIYEVDLGALTSGVDAGEIQARLHTLFNEAAISNTILVFPDAHILLSREEGHSDITNLFSTYLQSTEVQIILITTPDSYYRLIKPLPALTSYLLPVEVHEMTAREALELLEDESPRFEVKTHHIMTYQALTKIIEVSEQHIHNTPYPQKAIELLEEVATSASQNEQVFIFGRDVERILGQKLKLPLGQVAPDERELLNNLEAQISQRIVGQREAVTVVANALRRARSGLHSGKRPVGTFLFLGPTGVGKTEMAKTIAALYYKNDKAFIRLDMTEYQGTEGVEKMIGSSAKPGILTTALEDQPFSVVLLDEIEKASPEVRNIFLQILDEGRVTDGFGKHIDFTNAMIIATSNAGAAMIREAVEEGTMTDQFKARLMDWIQSQGIFTPEWLNRFDAVVTFLPLNRDEIKQVARLQVAELIRQLAGHNVHIQVSDDVYDFLVERGYDPQFGARPMRRAVQETIEAVLAKELLNNTAPRKEIMITRSLLQPQS